MPVSQLCSVSAKSSHGGEGEIEEKGLGCVWPSLLSLPPSRVADRDRPAGWLCGCIHPSIHVWLACDTVVSILDRFIVVLLVSPSFRASINARVKAFTPTPTHTHIHT
mmetsp:Transcript_5811/g.16478  ORF Transcript_5811/g.16478 Transcript_5811/m.16478 type:complete len:108 (-) Transcript_5811:115-438(-)